MVKGWIGVLLLVVALPSAAQRPKKLIALGWDQLDQTRFVEHLATVEAQPFDGVMVALEGQTPDGKTVPLKRGHTGERWERAWFAPAVAELKAAEPQRMDDNFIMFGANPGNVDWFDDAGWEQIADHWRIAAWAAREAGFAGLEYDPEPYTRPAAQFSYAAQPGKDEHTFAEYHAKARERGRQVMAAVAAEYPDMVLLTLFMNSVNIPATNSAHPMRALEASGYGLYPAFIDGWLDAAPEGMVFVDGCESSYLYNDSERFLEAAVKIKGACQSLVSPENRAAYRAQVQVGFGIYLDAYWNPKDSEWGRWYIDGLGGERVDRLRANVSTALRVADEYVWIYGEKYRWWPTPNGRVWEQHWDEGLPGVDRALRLAGDPLAYARSRALGGDMPNLARNGDFASATAPAISGAAIDWKEGAAPAGWSTWQLESSNGTFAWDREREAARAAGVENGCFIQGYSAEPGQLFYIRAKVWREGRGQAWLRARWRTSDGAWTAESLDRLAYPDALGPEPTTLELVAEVPEGAGELTLLLSMAGQLDANDVIWYDDVEVYRVE